MKCTEEQVERCVSWILDNYKYISRVRAREICIKVIPCEEVINSGAEDSQN